MNVTAIMKHFSLAILIILSRSTDSTIDLQYQQSDYHLKFHRGEVVSVEKSIMNEFKIKTFKYNRTMAALNVTINMNVDVKNNLDIVVQAYRFASNEYRIFPLRFQFPACQAFAANLGGIQNSYLCGNFSGCPFKKNVTYFFCNWTTDESKLPPFAPSGDYKVDVEGLYRSRQAFVAHFYLDIYR